MALDEESLTETVSEPRPSVGAALLHAARARTRRSARRSDRALPPPLTFYAVRNWTLERLRCQGNTPGMHEGIHQEAKGFAALRKRTAHAESPDTTRRLP